MRPNLKVTIGAHSEIHTLLSELISSLQPLTPVEHDIIHRAFYAGVAHESSGVCQNDSLFFGEKFSSDNSPLDLLAQAVYTQKQDARPARKRHFNEETFTIASLLHGMLFGGNHGSKRKRSRMRRKVAKDGQEKEKGPGCTRKRSRMRKTRVTKRSAGRPKLESDQQTDTAETDDDLVADSE